MMADRTAKTVLGFDPANSATIATIGHRIVFSGGDGAPNIDGVGVTDITYAYLNGYTPEEIAIHYDISLSQTFEALAMGLLMRSQNLTLPLEDN
jgi:uncharacterized protein (DUF433 family)